MLTTLQSCFCCARDLSNKADPEPKTIQGDIPLSRVETTLIQEEHGLIRIGDRIISRQFLTDNKIHVVSGKTKTSTVGHGGFGTVYDFAVDEQHRPFLGPGEWVFKPELTRDEKSYEKGYSCAKKYPLSKDGWIHSTLRSVTCYQIAKRMGINNIVETHIAICGNTHGMLMRKVEGVTVHEWLIKQGHFRSSARKKGYTEESIDKLERLKQPYHDQQFRDIIYLAFTDSLLIKRNLVFQMGLIRQVAFICGQGDRFKLTNLMLSFDPFNNPNFLTAIDNDFSFPIDNEYFSRNAIPIYAETSEVPPIDFRKIGEELVKYFFPESITAQNKRTDVLYSEWYDMTKNHGNRYGNLYWKREELQCSEVLSSTINSGGDNLPLPDWNRQLFASQLPAGQDSALPVQHRKTRRKKYCSIM